MCVEFLRSNLESASPLVIPKILGFEQPQIELKKIFPKLLPNPKIYSIIRTRNPQ